MSMYKPLAVVAATLALGACATVPKPLEGTFNDVSTANAQQGGAPGAKVRWGGEIIKTEPGPQQTCFFVLSEPLDSQARPTGGRDGQTQGRFVACRDGFYDPEVFTRGREITVTGTVHGAVSQKVGDFDYAYPRVEADVVYLWPKQVAYRYPPGYYDPFWGPGFGPYGYGGYGGWGPWGYGGYGGGYWGGPRRVIVVPRPVPHR